MAHWTAGELARQGEGGPVLWTAGNRCIGVVLEGGLERIAMGHRPDATIEIAEIGRKETMMVSATVSAASTTSTMIEYVILTQSIPADTGNHAGVARALELDVLLYLRGGWQPQGGTSCGQVNGRFVVMQAVTREVDRDGDDDD